MADITTLQWINTLIVFAVGSVVCLGIVAVCAWCVWTSPAKRGPFKSIILSRLLVVVSLSFFISGIVLPVYRVVKLILTMGGFL